MYREQEHVLQILFVSMAYINFLPLFGGISHFTSFHIYMRPTLSTGLTVCLRPANCWRPLRRACSMAQQQCHHLRDSSAERVKKVSLVSNQKVKRSCPRLHGSDAHIQTDRQTDRQTDTHTQCKDPQQPSPTIECLVQICCPFAVLGGTWKILLCKQRLLTWLNMLLQQNGLGSKSNTCHS